MSNTIRELHDKLEETAEVLAAKTDKPEGREVHGTVTNCSMLHMRETPDANAAIVATIPFKAVVLVDLNESTEDFYKVCNAAGIEGFCMKPYIALGR